MLLCSYKTNSCTLFWVYIALYYFKWNPTRNFSCPQKRGVRDMFPWICYTRWALLLGVWITWPFRFQTTATYNCIYTQSEPDCVTYSSAWYCTANFIPHPCKCASPCDGCCCRCCGWRTNIFGISCSSLGKSFLLSSPFKSGIWALRIKGCVNNSTSTAYCRCSIVSKMG